MDTLRPVGFPVPSPSQFFESRPPVAIYRMDMDLVGANPHSLVTAEEPTGEHTSYYLAHCPGGINGVPAVRKLIYHDIYPHIDLVFYGSDRGIKYDFLVRPGGRCQDIAIRYSGADSILLRPTGEVRIVNPLGVVEEGLPTSYQEVDAPGSDDTTHHVGVGSRFKLEGGLLRFDVGSYDSSVPLVIDPVLTWSTYLGGSSLDESYGWSGSWGGQSIGIDSHGSICFTATTYSSDFPVTTGSVQSSLSGSYDLVIVKMNSTGQRVWATYYGGTNNDWGAGVAVDSSGNVFIDGTTSSTDCPVSIGAFQSALGGSYDELLIKLDSSGVRLWGTYFGGTNQDWGSSIASDPSGNVIMTGNTYSTSLATANAMQTSNGGNGDVVITKFSATGSRLWSTYFGGSGQEYYGGSLCTDLIGNIYCSGSTSSTNLSTTSGSFQSSLAGSQDAFILKLDSAGSKLWATYVGGSSYEYASGIAVDRDSNVYISGSTQSVDFPTTSGAFQTSINNSSSWDGYVFSCDWRGRKRWATYLGGSLYDWLGAIATDSHRNVVVTGYSSSTDFPVTSDAIQSNLRGQYDAVLAKFDSSGTQRWGTYFGGSNYDWGYGVIVDRNAIVLLGNTFSSDLPVTSDAFQSMNRGSYDLFLAKFCDVRPELSVIGPRTICPGDSIVLRATPGFDTYRWNNGAVTPNIIVRSSGDYWVVASNGACTGVSDTVHINMFRTIPPVITLNGSAALCPGDSSVLQIPSKYLSQRWSNGEVGTRIVVRDSGRYTVEVIDSNGCHIKSDTIRIVLNPKPNPSITVNGSKSVCMGDSVELDAGAGFTQYLWSTFQTSRKIWVKSTGTYTVRVSNEFYCSDVSASVFIRVNPLPDATIRSLTSTVLCEGDTAILAARPGYFSYRWSTGDTSARIRVATPGRVTLTVADSNGCTAVSSAQIQIEPRPWQSIAAVGPTEFCEGDSVVLDVGYGYQNYLWSNGAKSQRVVVKQSGKYWASFQSLLGCSGGSDTIIVVVHPRPVASISGPVAVCSNSVSSYSVPLKSGLQYVWSVESGAGTLLSGNVSPEVKVQWGVSGTSKVSVRVTDPVTGCSTVNMISVRVGSGIQPVIIGNRVPQLCVGDSIELDAGPGYASYLWSTGDTSRRIVVRDTGRFVITVTDAGGCRGESNPFIVRRSPDLAPVITPLGSTNLCPGSHVELDAGAGYDSYRWSNGTTGRFTTVSTAGSYRVTVTDEAGCSGTSPDVIVSVTDGLHPVIDGPNSVCLNTAKNYFVTGPTTDQYNWTVSSGGLIVAGQGTPSIKVLWGSTGTEYVMLSQSSIASGCTATAAPYMVTIGATVVPTVSVNGSTVLCQGEHVLLTAPSGYDSYEWSNGATDQQISVDSAGVYRVTVRDRSGCSGTSISTMVTVRPSPVVGISSSGKVQLCYGDSLQVTATPGFLTYKWSTGETASAITIRSAGEYLVAVTDAAGCSATSAALSVSYYPAPMPPSIRQHADSLIATESVGYQWYVDGRTIPAATSRYLVATEPGSYTVRITDVNGCTSISDSFSPHFSTAHYGVALDTVSARAGDRLVLTMRTMPAIERADSIRSFRIRLQVDPKALFTIGEASGPAIAGVSVSANPSVNGEIIVERPAGSIISGGELFRLEMLGLTSGQAVNRVEIKEAILGVDSVTSHADGIVLLSGCDIGRGLAIDKVASIRYVVPNPIATDAIMVYRSPVGTFPVLTISDLAGQVLETNSLPEGTGAEQQTRIHVDGLASGLYRFELRDRAVVSAIPVVVVK